jgi:hypothetical protein
VLLPSYILLIDAFSESDAIEGWGSKPNSPSFAATRGHTKYGDVSIEESESKKLKSLSFIGLCVGESIAFSTDSGTCSPD